MAGPIEIPDEDAAATLRKRVVDAWREVAMPHRVMWFRDPLESNDPVEEYFHERDVARVDLEDATVSDATTLSLMFPEAIHYYIQAYLLYMLDVRRHAASPARGCMGYAAIGLLGILCGELRVELPPFSLQQAECILDVLNFVERYLAFYYIRHEDNLDRLWHGIRYWSAYCENVRAGHPLTGTILIPWWRRPGY